MAITKTKHNTSHQVMIPKNIEITNHCTNLQRKENNIKLMNSQNLTTQMSIIRSHILVLDKNPKRLNHINSTRMTDKNIKIIKNHSQGKRYKVRNSMMTMMINSIFNNKRSNLEVLGRIKITKKIIMTITKNINKIMIIGETLSKMHTNIPSRVKKITPSQQNNLKDQRNSPNESFSMNRNNLLVMKAERTR